MGSCLIAVGVLARFPYHFIVVTDLYADVLVNHVT